MQKTNCIGILYDLVYVLVFWGGTWTDGGNGHEEGMEAVDLGAGWEPAIVGVREGMK